MSDSSGPVPVSRPGAQSLGFNSQGEEELVITAPAGKPGYGPGSLAADLGKIPRTPIQAESSAAIHAAARWSTAQLQKTQAEYVAHQNALAAAQAKAKAARDALTLRLTQESNARIHNTYVNPAIAGAHANNMAMQAEAARLGAAKAAARAREKAEQEARQAEAELLAQQEAAAKAKAEADAEARLREQENRTRLSMEMNVTPPVPVYTPEMVQKAESAMIQPGIMALPSFPG
ncbi:hypothetical protein KAC00_003917 [Salmonella enterica]|nr:hypothetical protein [Salmonella enterica subsp. enterica]EHJ0379635.1 hypothetical protein [Salmonella enterica]EHW8690985.1 hypothetical protein [Salmonella enterica subsp. enterica serovar Saintpaul]